MAKKKPQLDEVELAVEPIEPEQKAEAPAEVVVPAESVAGHALSIRSKQDSFWRCGRKFTKTPVVIELVDLTSDEVKRLSEEPSLIVEAVQL